MVWDIAGVIGPQIYHPHVPCRLAAVEAIEGATIGMLQKLIRYASVARLAERMPDSSEEEEEEPDVEYKERAVSMMNQVLRVIL